MKQNMTEQDVLTMVRDKVREHRTQVAAARYFDISPQFMNAVLQGLRPPTAKMAEKLGLERTVVRYVVYRPHPGPQVQS